MHYQTTITSVPVKQENFIFFSITEILIEQVVNEGKYKIHRNFVSFVFFFCQTNSTVYWKSIQMILVFSYSLFIWMKHPKSKTQRWNIKFNLATLSNQLDFQALRPQIKFYSSVFYNTHAVFVYFTFFFLFKKKALINSNIYIFTKCPMYY
jgi:hypothetical protein